MIYKSKKKTQKMYVANMIHYLTFIKIRGVEVFGRTNSLLRKMGGD